MLLRKCESENCASKYGIKAVLFISMSINNYTKFLIQFSEISLQKTVKYISHK